MTRPPDRAWDYPGLAYCGAVTGAIVEIAYNIYAIRIGSFDATYLFRHILIEAVIFAAVGAILAFTSSFISNRLLQRPWTMKAAPLEICCQASMSEGREDALP